MNTNDIKKRYANEAVEIIKDLIVNNDLVKGEFINKVGCSENGNIIYLEDILNNKIEYNLSEVSYIFTDYLDCLGDMNMNAYGTVLSHTEYKNYEAKKELFIKSLVRLREIEACI